MSAEIRKRISRPAASATWEYTYHWGAQIGDSTTLRVIREDGGGLSIAYGNQSVRVRADLVSLLAEMVAAASEWSDGADS